MNLSLSLSIVSGLLHILAFVIYNKQVLQGTSEPNRATWILWAFITTLNVSSYNIMSGDWVKCLLPLAGSVACILTFLLSLFRKKLSVMDVWGYIALSIGVISVLVWWHSRSATYANLILQFSFIVSFVPTYLGVWKDPTKEKAAPWYIWGFAYVLTTIVVILRWENQYQDLAYPICGLIFHVMVGVLTKRKVPKKE